MKHMPERNPPDSCGHVRVEKPDWGPCVMKPGHAPWVHVYREDIDNETCRLHRSVDHDIAEQYREKGYPGPSGVFFPDEKGALK